ncbi:MAG: hypothetical protein K6C35_10820 [Eubacterium sp.]|nr:hypothetical protein [Eubacterium sp.]SEF65292.1 hypothetical protein SAMN04487934_10241 [Eubacterium ruminantium]
MIDWIMKRLLRLRRDDSAGHVLAQLIIGIFLISIIFLAAGLIIVPGTGKIFYLVGLLAGAALAVAAVINMYDALDAGLRLNEKGAATYIRNRSLLRIALAFVILLVAVFINIYAFVGVTLGLISIKLSGLSNKFIRRYLTKED